MKLFVLIVTIVCFAGIAHGNPGLPPVIAIAQPGGAYLQPWLNDGQETTVDGGQTIYVAAGAAGAGSVCTRANPCSYNTGRGQLDGGDNLLLRCGDTFGHLALQNAPSGSPSNWTIFGAWGNCGGGRPVTDNNGTSHNIVGKSYVWIDRIRFFDNGPIRHWTNTHHWNWTRVANEQNHGTCFQGDNRGGRQTPPHTINFARVLISGCGVAEMPCIGTTNGDEGLYFSSSNPPDVGAAEIHAWNVLIEKTTKEPANWKTDTKGLSFRYSVIRDIEMCDDVAMLQTSFNGVTNAVLEGNIIHNVSKPGKSASIFDVGPSTIVRNNLTYDSDNTIRLLRVGETDAGSLIAHNTFARFAGPIYHTAPTSAQADRVANNIGPTNNGGLAYSASLFQNPGANDFRLKAGSAAINNNANCRGVVNDIFGNSRPASGNPNCDTGAHEFSGTPPIDPPPGSERFVAINGNDSTGNGSSTTPWRTIQHCVNQMAVPGSTCTIRQGTYTENVVVANKVGTSFNPTGAYTIRAAPDATVTIQPIGGVNVIRLTDNSAFVIVDASETNAHMIADGSNITGDVVLVDGHLGTTGSSADFSRIRQLEIRNGPFTGIGGVAGTGGMEYLQNHIHNNSGVGIYIAGRENIIAGNQINDNGGIGIWLNADGTSNASAARVYNNTIKNNTNTAIRLDFSSASSIYNNEIAGNGGGIWLVNADSSGTAIDFNSIANNAGHGIRHAGATGTRIGSNAVFGNTSGQIFVESGTPTQLTNLVTDPLWINPATGDLRLKGGSPALDTGTCITTITADINGRPRPGPENPACDIGAHEGASTPPLLGGERFVSTTGNDSTGTGLIGAPWRTIQHCHDQIQATGSICTIRGGTYAENVSITKIGTSFVDGFLFRVFPNETAIIMPTSGTHALRITDNSAFVQVSATQTGAHLILDGSNITGDVLRIDAGADNARIWDIEIRNGPAHCVQALAGSTDLDFQVNHIHDCDFTGMTLTGSDNIVLANDIMNNGTSGLWLTSVGSSDASRARVYENEIEGNAATGIYISTSTQVAVFNNEIAGNGVNGITLENSTVVGAAIRFNSIANNASYGIRHSGAVSTTLGSNAVSGNGFGQIFVESGTPNLQTNLQTDPHWINAAAGDLRLKELSPALNAGTCAATITTDFARQPRPAPGDPRCDIGAHEGFLPGTGPPPQVENAGFRIMGGRYIGGRID